VQSVGLRVEGFGFGFRVSGVGFWVWSVGFRVRYNVISAVFTV